MVSAPAPPSSVLLPALPMMTLASPLPVPLMLALAGQDQVLDIGAERVVDRRLHRVVARVERLRDHVAGVVDHVDVVARAADHGVGAAGAVERVVAATAGEDVDARIAGERIVAAAAGDVLDPGHEEVKPEAKGARRLTVTALVVPV